MKEVLALGLLFILLPVTIIVQSDPLPATPADSTLANNPAVKLSVYSDSLPGIQDNLLLKPADSVFVFDGELYFRARAGGQSFFISQRHLLDKSDSLVVYQMFRLGNNPDPAAMPDSLTSKIPRQRCTGLTKYVARCRRWAEPNSDKCWQHQ